MAFNLRLLISGSFISKTGFVQSPKKPLLTKKLTPYLSAALRMVSRIGAFHFVHGEKSGWIKTFAVDGYIQKNKVTNAGMIESP
jgi:hypothetical protein